MADSTAFSIEIRTCAGWRLGVAGLTAASLLVVGLWIATLLAREELAWIWLAMAALPAIAAAASMRWVDRARLRWDGGDWHLARSAPPAMAEQAGTMAVALDGGSWMLLRFRARAATERPRITWLALSRHDLGGAWHALRCAVYSPRPDPAGPSAQAPADPSE
jgi:hypothetical protein